MARRPHRPSNATTSRLQPEASLSANPEKDLIHKCLNRKDFGEAADCRTASMSCAKLLRRYRETGSLRRTAVTSLAVLHVRGPETDA